MFTRSNKNTTFVDESFQSVVILSMLVSHYKIELRDPDQYEGLTVLEKREKLLQSKPGITTT